ncbi:MAG TPA: hypothetical protein VFW78_12080 [Bacteroidia bacterium]|nr:hypothetical protein [Bacteroidia bacterium]
MKTFSVFAFLIVLGMTSCGKLYLRLKYDVRNFKPRNTSELKSYLADKGIAYDQFLRISETAFNEQSHMAFKPGWKEGLRPIQMRAFDSTGIMIMQWAVCEGFFEMLGTLDTFPPRNTGVLVPHDLTADLQQYNDNSGKTPDPNQFKPFDLCLVVYWSRAFGEMGLRSIRPVNAFINRFRDKRIVLLMVSLDPQKDWKVKR